MRFGPGSVNVHLRGKTHQQETTSKELSLLDSLADSSIDWLSLTLGGVDSLGVSPQWQQPSSITDSPTRNRLDNQQRMAAIRRPSTRT